MTGVQTCALPICNSIAHGWSPIASHYIEIELGPGELKDLIFVLGYVENGESEKWDKEQ